jgi:hypothetical protein
MDARLRFAFLAVAAVGAAIALVAWIFWGGRVAVSVAVGSALSVANLYVLTRIVRAFTSDGEPRARLPWGFVAVTKMAVLYGGVFLLARTGLVAILPLMAGLGALPIGLASTALLSDRTPK